MSGYPKTMQRGALKGQTFNTAAEYQDALDKARDNGLTQPRKKPSKIKASSTANGVTKKMADSLVSFANMILAVVPQTREDVLEDTEREAISLGIMETARSNKFFSNLIVKSCRLQAGSRLGVAVGCVVARRVIKRENLPIPIETRVAIDIGACALLNILAEDSDLTPSVEGEAESEMTEVPIPVYTNGHSQDVPPGVMVDPFNVASR